MRSESWTTLNSASLMAKVLYWVCVRHLLLCSSGVQEIWIEVQCYFDAHCVTSESESHHHSCSNFNVPFESYHHSCSNFNVSFESYHHSSSNFNVSLESHHHSCSNFNVSFESHHHSCSTFNVSFESHHHSLIFFHHIFVYLLQTQLTACLRSLWRQVSWMEKIWL
jgi:hypothetical protein